MKVRDASVYVEGLKEDGLPVPAPIALAEYIEAKPPPHRQSGRRGRVIRTICCVLPSTR
jgi:hypothetical protein